MGCIAGKEQNHLSSNINDDTLNVYMKNDEKNRLCLMCNNMFFSNGAHNRRCPKCTRLVFSKKKSSSFFMPHVFKAKSLPSKKLQ